ncbi:MAG TPA: aspartate aminotransferase family protein [Planctomycetes bacterium]|nr:aspartate aminotransferase family protein [Planctomycetota bacterium]
MTPEEFRAAGHELIDWIADYRSGLSERPVRAQVAPGEVRAALPADPPAEVEPFAALLDDLERVVVPGMTLVQHPMHFGWFPSNASLESVLGDLASSGLGGLGISWESCPALTEVEEVVVDWLRQLTGLSEAWSGTIHDTASTATLTALLAARERASDHAQTRGGLAGAAPLAVYTSEQAHSSVKKAALLAGYGLDHLRAVPCDPVTYAMLPAALAEQVRADLAAGVRPCAVVATTGTTASTAMDPLGEIAGVCAEHEVWLHVDAAMAGAAMLLPERRHLWEGVEQADSLTWNPHKWLGTILDCSLFYVRDVQHLVRVMSTNPSYLRSAEDGQVTQFRDWGIPLGRRFRALKLWFQLRLEGVEAIQARLRRDLANAEWLAEQVRAAAGWELAAPLSLQTLCVRHQPEGLSAEALDEHNRAWAERINRSGAAFLTPAKLGGRWVVRASIGVLGTEREHVARLWELMQEAASA